MKNIKTHLFTQEIVNVLKDKYPEDFSEIFEKSELLKYLNEKTISANKGSRSRGSFGNIYAIYVLVEDYIKLDVQMQMMVELIS